MKGGENLQTVEERQDRVKLWLTAWTAVLVFGSILLASEVLEIYQIVNARAYKQMGRR
jgi:folylpolyglutamate synthase/dihydropteroate synthase